VNDTAAGLSPSAASGKGRPQPQKDFEQALHLTHSKLGPALLAGLALWYGSPWLLQATLIWFAHIGFDRALGYGLKYASAFSDTHLGRIGRHRQQGA